MPPIYLDHAATTPIRPEVREGMLAILDGDFGNPSSAHRWGRRAAARLQEARERVAEARMGTALPSRSRARSRLVTTTAAAPSVSMQQSKKR